MCPDGKEKSEGVSIIKAISLIWYGRTRATNGFNVRLQSNREKIKAMQTLKPSFRVFGISERITPNAIQIQPPLPRKVIAFISVSINGLVKFSRMELEP